MHRKVRKIQRGSFTCKQLHLLVLSQKRFGVLSTAQAVTPVKTVFVFQLYQGSAGFSCNSSKTNYQIDQQHNVLDVVCPQVYVLSPKNTEQLQFHFLQCAICYSEERI